MQLTEHCLLQVDMLALQHNTLLLAYNDDSEASRSTLVLAMSRNEGHSWHNIGVLEADPRGSFHYPTLLYHEEQARLFQQDPCMPLSKVHTASSNAWQVSASEDGWE